MAADVQVNYTVISIIWIMTAVGMFGSSSSSQTTTQN